MNREMNLVGNMAMEAELTTREEKKKFLIELENLTCPTIAWIFTELLLETYVFI